MKHDRRQGDLYIVCEQHLGAMSKKKPPELTDAERAKRLKTMAHEVEAEGREMPLRGRSGDWRRLRQGLAILVEPGSYPLHESLYKGK